MANAFEQIHFTKLWFICDAKHYPTGSHFRGWGGSSGGGVLVGGVCGGDRKGKCVIIAVSEA